MASTPTLTSISAHNHLISFENVDVNVGVDIIICYLQCFEIIYQETCKVFDFIKQLFDV